MSSILVNSGAVSQSSFPIFNFINSSDINEVITSVLNFLFFFTKKFHKYKKAQNRLQRTKIKKVYKKHLSSNINEAIKTI